MRKFDKKVWGIPGKIKEYYSPAKFQQDKRIVPLNANPLDAWDTEKSRYRRVDLMPREMLDRVRQMDGINESSSQVTPTAPVVTASSTPQPTPTITPTPSSTPIPLLWNTYNIQWNDATSNWNNA